MGQAPSTLMKQKHYMVITITWLKLRKLELNIFRFFLYYFHLSCGLYQNFFLDKTDIIIYLFPQRSLKIKIGEAYGTSHKTGTHKTLKHVGLVRYKLLSLKI